MLHDPNVGGMLKGEEVLELAREAGFTEDQAQHMATDRANRRLERELEP
jgi:hypothetical protein